MVRFAPEAAIRRPGANDSREHHNFLETQMFGALWTKGLRPEARFPGSRVPRDWLPKVWADAGQTPRPKRGVKSADLRRSQPFT